MGKGIDANIKPSVLTSSLRKFFCSAAKIACMAKPSTHRVNQSPRPQESNALASDWQIDLLSAQAHSD